MQGATQPTEAVATERPPVDFGFGEDINRRIEINYDPESARYPIPKYLKRITDTLFSKATAREIFMVKLDSMSKLKSSKKWKSKGRLPLATLESKKSFKRSVKEGLPEIEEADHRVAETSQKAERIVTDGAPAANAMQQSKLALGNSILHRRNNSQKSQRVSMKADQGQNKLQIADRKPDSPTPILEDKRKEQQDWEISGRLDPPLKDCKVAPRSEASLKDEQSVPDIQTEKRSSMSSISINELKKEVQSPKKAAAGSREAGVGKCVVCCMHEPDCVMMPCGHAGVCNFCSINIFDSHGKCPICRAVDPI